MMQAVLTDAVSGRPIPASVLQGALGNRFLRLMWQLAALQVRWLEALCAVHSPDQA